ncbi:hypothetical protein [Salisediminibacterium beveridgei]|uniref:hypothetical protein n=1 Tax=Salisediminibacterium beveridgei TaxID=632773 RepID=UPI0012ECBDE3|nr:hypothetical protein [Salisediminibacterium beveridgei]
MHRLNEGEGDENLFFHRTSSLLWMQEGRSEKKQSQVFQLMPIGVIPTNRAII